MPKWCVIVHCTKESRPKFSWRITLNFCHVWIPPRILLVFHFWAMRRQLAAAFLGMWLDICSWVISTQSAASSSCARFCQKTDVADDQHKAQQKAVRTRISYALACSLLLLPLELEQHFFNSDACLLLLRLSRVPFRWSWRPLEHSASNKFLQQLW